MALRIRRIKDNVVFNWTKALSIKPGFIAFEDNPETEKPSGGLGAAPAVHPIENMTRKQIGEFILEKYDIQIPKMNRGTDDIRADAYRVIEQYAEKDEQEKREAEEREAIDAANAEKERKEKEASLNQE